MNIVRSLNYFDFTPKFTSVRAYILSVLDREDYIQKTYELRGHKWIILLVEVD